MKTLKIQSELTKELDNTFGNFIQADIGLISDAIDKILPEKIENILIDYTDEIVIDSKVDFNKIKTIKTKTYDLQIRIHESILNPTELLIGYIPILNRGNYKTKMESIDIEGYGKFEKLTLICPNDIDVRLDLVLLYCKTIIENCYSWFFQKLKMVIKENTITASYIYSCIKALFPNKPEIYKAMWLLVVNNGKATYLLDEENIEYALSKIKSYDLIKSESPLSQINELLKMSIDYENTFIRQAAIANKSLSTNPLDSKSAEYSTLLAIGEAGIWEEDATAFPIITEGKLFLFLAFPTKFIKEVEPVLLENKEYISNEFKKFHSRINKVLKLMKRQNYDLGEIGKFAGNFLGGVLNSMK